MALGSAERPSGVFGRIRLTRIKRLLGRTPLSDVYQAYYAESTGETQEPRRPATNAA